MNVYRASITAFVLGVVAKHRPHCRCLQCPKLGVWTAWLTMCQPAASCSDVNLNVWSDPFIRCAHLCAILVQLMYTSYQPRLQTSSIQLASLPDALLGFKGTNVGVLLSVSKAEDIWGYLRKLVWSGSHYLILFDQKRVREEAWQKRNCMCAWRLICCGTTKVSKWCVLILAFLRTAGLHERTAAGNNSSC